MFSLAGSPLGLIFVGLGFWWVCHAFFCFFVFSKWWKVQEWQIEVLYAYKKNNMNNASIYFPLTSEAQEHFRGVKIMYYSDMALQCKYFGGNNTQDFFIEKSYTDD